jgi:hypothetical protein
MQTSTVAAAGPGIDSMNDDFHVPEITFRLVAGAALLVVATVTFVAQETIRRRVGRADRPKRRLLVYSGGASGEQPGGLVDVSGTVVSPPSLHAPVSGRACALWELSLYAVIPETEYSPQRYDHLWITARSGDLVVTYDERWDIRLTPGSERPEKNASGGSRLEVSGDKVSFRPPDQPNSAYLPGLSWFHSSGYQPADPVLLQRLGPPEELLTRVRANPRAYVVTEGSVATGEFIRLTQRSATPIAGPNPGEPFFLYPMSHESIGAFGIGCLAKVSTLFAVTAAVVGAAMVYSELTK